VYWRFRSDPRAFLVAHNEVLGHALHAEGAVDGERQAPESAVVLAEIIGRGNRAQAFSSGDSVDAAGSGVGAVQVSGFALNVANAGLAGEPILPGPGGGVGIGERSRGRECGKGYKFLIDDRVRGIGKILRDGDGAEK